jgi:hypothetical protein
MRKRAARAARTRRVTTGVVVQDTQAGYRAAAELEGALEGRREVLLTGGRYQATIVRVTSTYYEAWTETPPFVYGRARSTLQEALDDLEARVSAAEHAATRRAS